MEAMKISTSERVKIARERAGILMTDMAEHLGMTRETYRTRENGSASWRLDELRQIAEITGVTIHELIG